MSDPEWLAVSAKRNGVASHTQILRWSMRKGAAFTARLRGAYYRALIRLCGAECGPNLQVGRGLVLRIPPHGGLRIGRDVVFGHHTVLEVEETALLTIGNSVKFTGYTTVSASNAISIGDFTLVAEYVSIRDSNHGVCASTSIHLQRLHKGKVAISDGVWLGRGVSVLKDARIGRGCVVGANSVVNRELPAMTISVGIPARPIKTRPAE